MIKFSTGVTAGIIFYNLLNDESKSFLRKSFIYFSDLMLDKTKLLVTEGSERAYNAFKDGLIEAKKVEEELEDKLKNKH